MTLLSKLALMSTAAAFALGLTFGAANAAQPPYKPSGMAKAIGSDVEDIDESSGSPGKSVQRPAYKATGMAKAIGSDVEDIEEGSSSAGKSVQRPSPSGEIPARPHDSRRASRR
jgi:hypothetical protein